MTGRAGVRAGMTGRRRVVWGSWSTTLIAGLGLVALVIAFIALGPIYALVVAVGIGLLLLVLAGLRRSDDHAEGEERARRDEVDRMSAGSAERGGPHTGREDVPEPLPASPEGPSRAT